MSNGDRVQRSAAQPRAGEEAGWTAIAGEFLEEHWQKLILCLAVLLIVVSTTAGAHHLLGPLLWRPEGKCALGLLYTLLFGAFGCGLVRWGAEGAGRMVLLTTLGVVPVNFALAGELQMLSAPGPLRLLVLGVVAPTLLLVSFLIPRLLQPRCTAPVLLAFFTLSAVNAVVAPGIPSAWGLALCLLPGLLFLGTVTWETHISRGARREIADALFPLGILSYAFLFEVLRAGFGVLDLVPTLFALPVVVVGIACVLTAASTAPGPSEEGTGAAGLLQFTGQLLVGIAFALALARPPVSSPLYSGNTLATAVMGLALFAGCLCATRRPVYLYLAFAALFVSYFGAGYFISDVMRALEDAARRALGYDRALPLAFKSLNALAFNTLLAGLALFFDRRWKEPHLARHCHWIGLPLSVAACLLSAFEPKAAVLCLAAYALLYALAAWLFAMPGLIYLACGSFVGAACFVSILLPGVGPEHRALGAALIGIGFWFIHRFLTTRNRTVPYQAPLYHASLGISAIGLDMAAVSLAASPPSALTTTALAATACLFALWVRTSPEMWLAYLAMATGCVAYGVGVWGRLLALGVHPLTPALAVASGALALLLYTGGERLVLRSADAPRTEDERLDSLGGTAGPIASRCYQASLLHTGLAMVGVTWLLCGLTWDPFALIAAALALAALTLTRATRLHPHPALAHLSIASALGSWLFLFETTRWATADPAGYALLLAAFALALVGLAEWRRRSADGWPPQLPASLPRPEAGLWIDALSGFALPMIALAVTLAASQRPITLPLITTLSVSAGMLLWLTRFHRERALVYAGLATGVAAALCFTAWWLGAVDPGVRLAWLGAIGGSASIALWRTGSLCRRRGPDPFYGRPSFETSRLLALAAFPVLSLAVLWSPAALPAAVAGLLIDAAALLLLTTVWRSPALTAGAAVALTAAAHLGLHLTTLPRAIHPAGHGLLSAILSIAFWLTAFTGRRRSREAVDRVYWQPLSYAALSLALLAAPLSLSSPLAMLVVAVSFLLMLHRFPAAAWLYAVIGCVGWAAGTRYLHAPPDAGWVKSSLVAAFGLWGLGAVLQRFKEALCARLDLPLLGYEFPPFNLAAVAAAFALALRSGSSLIDGETWTAHLILLPTLAFFALLMLKAYPRRACVHIAVALLTLTLALKAAPLLSGPLVALEESHATGGRWLLFGMALAVFWHMVHRAAEVVQGPLCRRLEVHPDDYARVPVDWSAAAFGIAAALVAGVVVLTAAVAVLGAPLEWLLGGDGWWMISLSLLLAAAYLLMNRRSLGAARLLVGMHALLLLALWWLGTFSSPAATRPIEYSLFFPHPDPQSTYYPLVTAGYALFTVLLGCPLPGRSGVGRSASEEKRREWLAGHAERVGSGLVVISLLFTCEKIPRIDAATVLTLALAVAAAARLAFARRRIRYAYAGGALLVWECVAALLVATGEAGAPLGPEVLLILALGLAAAAFALLLSSGWLHALAAPPERSAGERVAQQTPQAPLHPPLVERGARRAG